MDTIIAPEVRVLDLKEGQKLVEHEFVLPFVRIAQVTATMGDWFPGHYDPNFAARQGKPTIYANTIHIQGLLDKFVLDNLGADRVVRRRRMWMRKSVLADAAIVITGEVRSVDREQGHVVVFIAAAVNGEEAVTAQITVGDSYVPGE